MRQAVGATWVFAICMTFILMFTAYVAISINYSKAYKMKNYIVNKIETLEGYNESDNEAIIEHLVNSGYTAKGSCDPDIVDTSNDQWDLIGTIDGQRNNCSACVYRLTSYDGSKAEILGNNHTQYRVITFFRFDLPVIGRLLTFKVGGESSYFYGFNEEATN